MTRLLFILTIVFFSTVSFGQFTDWTALTGKWECEKVILVRKTNLQFKDKDSSDISKDYKPYYLTYFANLKCKEEYPYPGIYSTVDGQYKLDKTSKKISYSKMVQTTKYSGGKVAVPDLVLKTGKEEDYVIKISADKLVLIEKYLPESESQGDYIYYFKKVK